MKLLLVLFCMMSLTGCFGVKIIDSGHRGIYKTFGKVDPQVVNEGFHIYNPLTSSIEEMNVQERKFESDTYTYTKDTQKVTIHYVLNFYPESSKMPEIYNRYGGNWERTLVPQVALGTIKDNVGKINADDLNGERDKTAHKIEEDIKTKLSKVDIVVRGFELTSVTFEKEYEKAVEAKVIATQKAIEAKNRTAEVQEQATQKIIEAKADAESMKIRSQALSQNRSLVEYEAVQKWDGKLPQMMLSDKSMPFIKLNTDKSH